jgi:hypothetical protein
MNIKEKFLELTNRTYPHGTEGELFPILFNTVDGLQSDEFGNLFIKVGESDVMFTSHLDTATSANTPVNHVFDGKIIKTDGKSILGADDKAGVTIMLSMIKNNIPGLYYFFLGEEVGCVGSKKVAAVQKETKIEGINKVISFDRRGTTSVITYQSGRRCASDTFGRALAGELNKADDSFEYIIDPTGVLTDSVQFISIYPECTNISVGYQSELTFSETQDIEHLTKLAEACLKVDWNGLPVERDPSVTEYKSYGSGWGYPGWDDDDYYYGSRYGSRQSGYSTYNNWGSITKPKTKTENVWFHDRKYNYVSKIEIEDYTKKVISVDIHKDRIIEEKSIIDSLIKSLDIDYKTSDWNGFKYKLNYETGYSTECDRNDLIEYLPELDYSKGCDLESDVFDTDSKNDMCDSFYD